MTRAEMAAAVQTVKPRLFDGLTNSEIRIVLDCARSKSYEADSIVHREGECGEQMFLLLSGRARFFTLTPAGEKVLLFWAAPGEVLGGVAILARQCDYLLSSET